MATIQVVHCPLHPFSTSASKHTGMDSLPHHIDQSIQIARIMIMTTMSCLLVLYHLEWQQCLWASWKCSPEKTWQRQLSHSFNDQEQAPMLPEGSTLRVQRKRETWVCPRESTEKKWHNNQQSESGEKMEENWHDNQPQTQIANMRMRGEGRKRKEPGQEKCWKNEATTDPRSTDPSTEER
jgi:hypothetical protein